MSGRPPIFKTPDEMESAIERYFEYIQGEEWDEHESKGGMDEIHSMKRYPEPPTITGLILYIGFSHREALHDYEKKPEFSDIVKRARLRVENGYEKALYGKNPTGSIFALKNMGWRDKVETEHSGNVGHTVLLNPQSGCEPIKDGND